MEKQSKIELAAEHISVVEVAAARNPNLVNYALIIFLIFLFLFPLNKLRRNLL